MIDIEQQFSGKAGALFPVYRDPKVTDILINGPGHLFIERDGILFPIASPFERPSELFDFVERLLLPIGRRIDATQPYVDGRLTDGGRFHILLPPLAVSGPYISIRKLRPRGEVALADFGDPGVIDWLHQVITDRKNLLVSGGTGSGKTTLISRLVDLVPAFERVAIIEESMEIQTLHSHAIRLETRPATPEGIGLVSAREILRNVLRMRPDRIVLGECRGAEAFDLLQALNSGHTGSLGTIHANSCLDALRRLEALVLLTGFDLSPKMVRQWVASGIGGVINLKRDGRRRTITEIIELTGLEGESYRHRPLFQESVRPADPLFLAQGVMV